MTAARWNLAKSAFHQAYDLPHPQRAQFLGTLDPDLRSDVESLLLHDPGDFLEKTATQYVMEFLQHEPVPERLGPYRILKELGRGGMASVFLAERADGQFEKRVAIKILHGGITGSDMQSRFLQERQLLANLDHPNIVRLLDGNVTPDGRPYLVQDFIEGQSITTYAIERNLPRRDRILLFLQVVGAIEYSHSLGIVHRDIKPTNILAAAGTVKLIDFGIATLITNVPTADSHLRYWTPGYASPEQARGEAIDTPSDIYSLGAVLLELLTAQRSTQRTAHLLPGLHGPLRTLLQRCLSEHPAQRPTATELRLALLRFLRPNSTWLWLAAAALGIIAAAALFLKTPADEPLSSTLSIPISAEASFEYEPVLSPDGKEVVFAWNEGDTTRGINLYRKAVAGGAPEQLTHAYARDAFPQYSPDGREILFSRSSRQRIEIIILNLATRREHIIHRIESPLEARQRSIRWAVWMADGNHIVLVRRLGPAAPYALFMLRTDGAVLRQLTEPSLHVTGDQQASASPDGRYIAFVRFATGTTSDIYLLPLHGGQPRRLTHHNIAHNGIAWSPDSRHVYFGARIRSTLRSIYRSAIAPGSPAQRITGVEGNATWPNVASFAGHQRIVYQRDDEIVNVHAWDAPWKSGAQSAICPSTLYDGGVSVSPDGAHLAFRSTRGGSDRIWVCHRASGKAETVSDPGHPYADAPRWSPDSSRIAYTITEGESTDIAVVQWKERRVKRYRLDGAKEGRPSWSRDGRFLYFRSDRDGANRIWRMQDDGELSSAVPITGPNAFEAIESLDGQWLYFTKERAFPGVFRVPATGGQEQLVAAGVREGLWDLAHDGVYWIRFQNGFFLERLRYGASQPERLAPIANHPGIWSGFSISPDGRTAFFSQTTRISLDVMLLDGL